MKALGHIARATLWCLAGVFLALAVLLRVPAVQHKTAHFVSDMVADKLGTRCNVGTVSLGLAGRVVIDDVVLFDQRGDSLLSASRMSVKVGLVPLMSGRISVSSAQLFGMDARLVDFGDGRAANYQFVLDSLAPKDSSRHNPLHLNIGSLIIRRGKVSYDNLAQPATPGLFNRNHLRLSDISAHVMVPLLTKDSASVNLKKLSFKEHCGLDVRHAQLKFDFSAPAASPDNPGAVPANAAAVRGRATISDLKVELAQSALVMDHIAASSQMNDGKPDFSTLNYEAEVNECRLSPNDIKCLVAEAANLPDMELRLKASVNGNHRRVSVENVVISSSGNELDFRGNLSVSDFGRNMKWAAQIDELSVATPTLLGRYPSLNAVTRLGTARFKGTARGTTESADLDGIFKTDAGEMTLRAGVDGNSFGGTFSTPGTDLGKLLDNNDLGTASATLRFDGQLEGKKLSALTVEGTVPRFDYNHYSYSNISANGTYRGGTFDGELAMDDPNGAFTASGTVDLGGATPSALLSLALKRLNPQRLHLSDKLGNATFSTNVDVNMTGNSAATLNGNVTLSDFRMERTDETGQLKVFTMQRCDLVSQTQNGRKTITLDGEIGHVQLEGTADPNTIGQSVMYLLGTKLPTFPGLKHVATAPGNNFTLDAIINRSDWLDAIFQIPLRFDQPVTVHGTLNDRQNTIALNMEMPSFHYDDSSYGNARLSLSTTDNGNIEAASTLRKHMDNGIPLDIKLNATAGENLIESSVAWTHQGKQPVSGSLNTTTKLMRNEFGVDVAQMSVHPSEIKVNDTIWHVKPSFVEYSKKNLLVNDFAIEHNKQHIAVSGKASTNSMDSLTVDLHNVNVNYILDLVNFHSVEFSGYATGTATVKSAFGTPDAQARLTVSDFRFQGGRMGKLVADARYNNTAKQIDIMAGIDDEEKGHTDVTGYVSPARNYIDLDISAHGTRLEFLEGFCKSFMSDVEATGVGSVNLYGDLKNINIKGNIVANGGLRLTPLNTHYTLRNDTIRLIPNEIIFERDTVNDAAGHIAIVEGALHHKYLKKLTYELDIRANNLLCYDRQSYGDDTFFGKIFASGTCRIKGRSGRIDIDIEATPQRNSFIEYDAASPDAISNQEFITWQAPTAAGPVAADDDDDDISSDMHINFLINANPLFTLRLLMDKGSGDKIALNGSGTIRASYYNKGSFDMFGNFLVDHGTYRLTIQNMMKREFQFQSGGTIVFGGNAYNATLNLPAIYTLNGVSLSDLQIGRSFSSNNVRVDCLMNITGSPLAPHVEFDLDMPTVNSDAKQMVRSLINSEEEMNQQVIYLLSIGRFYNPDINNAEQNASQTSLAMQSLLSGTISQQINNVLGTFVNSSNWNFGANISTGNEGFYNAEYEGLLSGRLLNNRLLINGQFGYRDNPNATSSFIGDFDIRYLLLPNGNIAVKVYNQTNDRYFTRNSLNTQGVGLILKKDFNGWKDLFK